MKLRIFKYFIIIACLFFIYKYFQENEKIIEIISNVKYKNFFFIIFLSILLIFFYANIIFTTFRKLCNIQISKRKWLLIYFNSQFLNSIPLLGILYRANQLKKFQLNYDKFFGIYIMINWFFLFLSLFLFGIESLFIFKDVQYYNINISIIFLFLSFFFFIIPIIFAKILKFFFKKNLSKKNYFFDRFEKLINLFLAAITNRSFLKKFLILFLGIHIIEFFVLTQLVLTIKEGMNFSEFYIIFVGNILIDTFNILPQNLIISEIGMGFLTDRMNFDFELGILIKIYLRFIVFFSSVFLAILYNIYHLLFNRKNKS